MDDITNVNLPMQKYRPNKWLDWRFFFFFWIFCISIESAIFWYRYLKISYFDITFPKHLNYFSLVLQLTNLYK